MKTAQFASLYFTCLLGIIPVTAFSQPYTISLDGSEVTDTKTTLIWKRCPEGMTWSGTACTGIPNKFTQQAALQQATTQAGSTGVAWRLPNIKELSSIVDKNVINPAIDPTAFPVTPTNLFWSATPFVGTLSSAWVVDFYAGVVGGTSTNRNDTVHPYFVRLVRGGL